MNPNTIKIIKATAPVVAENANTITKLFYKTMFTNNPEAKMFFNVANQASGRQSSALANAVVAYASNIDNLGVLGDAVELMATKHCGLQVLPQHYHIVHDNLMKAVAEVLGDAITPEIGAAWSEAVMFLAKILIDEEEKLYKAAEAASGGWRGWKTFTVKDIKQEAKDIKTFTLEPQTPVNGPFAFTPGQFLSVTATPIGDNPRHYTITSKPGETFFQITTKRHEGGVVSSIMHDLQPGSSIQVSPPFGAFKVADPNATAVLMSAGVGVTPCKAFLDQLGDKVVKNVHVSKSPEHEAFHQYFETKNAMKNSFYYSEGGRPKADNIVDDVLKEVGSDHYFYVCGPTCFMTEVVAALKKNGVSGDKIKWEAFAPQLSCPVK